MIKYANSQNIRADVRLIDQWKAFGTVDPNVHLQMLEHTGFGDCLIFWIEIILRDTLRQI